MEEFPKRKELAFAQTAFRSSRKFLHFSLRSSTTCRSYNGGLNIALLVEVNGLLKLNIKNFIFDVTFSLTFVSYK